MIALLDPRFPQGLPFVEPAVAFLPFQRVVHWCAVGRRDWQLLTRDQEGNQPSNGVFWIQQEANDALVQWASYGQGITLIIYLCRWRQRSGPSRGHSLEKRRRGLGSNWGSGLRDQVKVTDGERAPKAVS